jgi:hypothetical protein
MMILISYGYVFLAIIIGLFILSVLIFLLIKPIKNLMVRHKIFKKLKGFSSTNKMYKLYKTRKMIFKYKLVLRNSIYYIYLLKNNKNYDIHFESGEFYFKDKKLKKKKSINLNDFKNYQPEPNKNRDCKKLIIVYPNCDFIYNHIDNFNSVYVYVDQELDSFHIISVVDFMNLEELK